MPGDPILQSLRGFDAPDQDRAGGLHVPILLIYLFPLHAAHTDALCHSRSWRTRATDIDWI